MEHFGKTIRSTRKDLKCGAGEGWREVSWTDRVRNEEVLQTDEVERNIIQTLKEGTLTGLVTSCVGTAF